jgi:hypothetical protein
MPRFERELRGVAERLDLPQPERARILEEIAGDLEELRSELIQKGVHPDEAEASAITLLAPSETALSALVSVHESLYHSLVRRFSSKMRLAEWAGLLIVTVFPLALVLSSLVGQGFLRNPSVSLLVVLCIAVGLVAVAGRKTIQLYIERDHDPQRLWSGMSALLTGSGLAVFCSVAGSVLELARVARRIELAPEAQGALLLPWLLDTSVLIGAGLTTALVGGLCWFLLLQKISAVERADLSALRATGRATATAALSFDPMTSTGAQL